MRMFLTALAVAVGLAGASPALAADKAATVFKDPQCGCCGGWIDHMQAAGYRVRVVDTDDFDALKRRHGIPGELVSCHTALVGGYVVEGHVPARIVDRLLAEKPKIRGVSLPGMPTGSPGMGGAKEEPFEIFEIGPAPRVYARD